MSGWIPSGTPLPDIEHDQSFTGSLTSSRENIEMSDSSLGTGVYYAEEDYVGLGKRILILTIDFCVLAIVSLVANVLWYSLPPNDIVDTALEWSFPVFAYFYLTVIKASKIRTLGYRLVGAKVLTLKGKRPSVWRMSLRLFIWVIGPINLVVDFIWVGIDEDRQSLRDRFAGTCVVKANAVPIGEASIHLFCYQAFGLPLMLPTVSRPRAAQSA